MSDLSNNGLVIELLSDENNYSGTNFIQLMACSNDLLGKEYCQIVKMMPLGSKYVQPTEPNQVVDLIECILIDPSTRREINKDCFTVRSKEAFVGDSQVNVPTLWSQ